MVEEKKPSFRLSRSFNLKRMFEGPAKHGHHLSFAGEGWNDNDDQYRLQSRSYVPRSPRHTDLQDRGRQISKSHSNVPKSPKPPSDAEQMKERFAKLLLGEDMSGGGKGVSSALALSNAITNLAASVFGEQKKLEPMSPDRKKKWRKEIDWLLSVTDHTVEFVPSKQQSPDGASMEIMVTRQRNDLHMNIPALRKLDATVIKCLDDFGYQNEFWYACKDEQEDENVSVQRTSDDKWWLPIAKVPADGLSENCLKWLKFQKECVTQVLKAAMAINAEIVSEMEIPESYMESLPKNGRSSLGDSLYKNITEECFEPDRFLTAIDLSTEHKVLDLKNRIEASVVIWKRKMNNKEYKSHWSGMPPAVSAEKREIFEERAKSILTVLKQRFPGLPQSALEISKIEHNKDIGHAILESYSRAIESLAHTVMSRIEGVLYADQLVQNSSNGIALSPQTSERTDNSDLTKSPRSPTLSQFMGWKENKGELDTRKNATLIDPSNAAEIEKIITKIANNVINMKTTYLEIIEGALRSPTARH